MKKILVCLLVLILAFSTVAISASAATNSPQATGVVSAITGIDKEGEVISFKLEKIAGKVVEEVNNALEKLKDEKKDETLKVVAQYESEVIGKPVFPVKVTLDVLGVSNASKVYVIVKEKAVANLSANNDSEVITLSNVYNLKATPLANDSNVKVIETTVENGKVKFTLDNPIETLSIVTDAKTAANVEKENNVVSPQTADNSVLVLFAAMASVLGLVVVSKKVKA